MTVSIQSLIGSALAVLVSLAVGGPAAGGSATRPTWEEPDGVYAPTRLIRLPDDYFTLARRRGDGWYIAQNLRIPRDYLPEVDKIAYRPVFHDSRDLRGPTTNVSLPLAVVRAKDSDRWALGYFTAHTGYVFEGYGSLTEAEARTLVEAGIGQGVADLAYPLWCCVPREVLDHYRRALPATRPTARKAHRRSVERLASDLPLRFAPGDKGWRVPGYRDLYNGVFWVVPGVMVREDDLPERFTHMDAPTRIDPGAVGLRLVSVDVPRHEGNRVRSIPLALKLIERADKDYEIGYELVNRPEARVLLRVPNHLVPASDFGRAYLTNCFGGIILKLPDEHTQYIDARIEEECRGKLSPWARPATRPAEAGTTRGTP